jgi:5,10-methylenetetrahydrofolate reductase
MSSSSIRVSFEFFPPGDAAMETTLWQSVQRLAPLSPRFVSVTYGADGSTRDRTHQLVSRIQRETHLTGAPHLTCVGATRAEVLEVARQYWREGIRHIVALRGDAPQGATQYEISIICARKSMPAHLEPSRSFFSTLTIICASAIAVSLRASTSASSLGFCRSRVFPK